MYVVVQRFKYSSTKNIPAEYRFKTVLAKRSCTEVNVLQYFIVPHLLNKLKEYGSLHPAAAPKVVIRRVAYSTT